MRLPHYLTMLCLGWALAATGAGADVISGADLSTLNHEPPLAVLMIQDVDLTPRLVWLSPHPKEEWLEGAPVTLQWYSAGPVKTVSLACYGDRSKLGGQSRGSFSQLIAEKVPNEGMYAWTVPWVDAGSFMVRIAGYDESGKLVAETERAVRFRAEELAGLQGTFLAVSKARQRLWYYRDGELKWISIVSTAEAPFTTPRMQPEAYGRRGEMGRVFYKDPDAFSHMYQVHMLWWMAITSSGSHGIHATSPGLYSQLGEPASHGCIRQHRRDAKALYDMVSVGTPVYVF